MSNDPKSPGYVETEVEAAKRAVLAVYPEARYTDSGLGTGVIQADNGIIGESMINTEREGAEDAAWIDAASLLPEEKEPAPKEGEKERPHQADCICRRCEDWDDAHEPAKVEDGEGLPPSSMAIEPMVGAWDLVDAIATGDEKSRFIAAELQQYRKASIVTNEAGHKEVKKILDQLKYALEENELLKSRIRDLERVYELGKNGNRSEAMTCPLPLHNPLRQKDGTFKCSGCPKTWEKYPTAKVIYPKGKR